MRCRCGVSNVVSGYFVGPSKKLAKNAAAKAALATLCDISYSPMQSKAPIENAPIESDKKTSYELPQTFADAIGKYVLSAERSEVIF